MNRAKSNWLIISFCTALIACEGEPSTQERAALARSYMASGDLQAANIEIKNALQEDPGNAIARLVAGELALAQGDYLGAEKELERAGELGAPETYLAPLLARVYLTLGRTEPLRALSSEGLTPENRAIVLASQGMADLSQGWLEEAAALIEQALQADPTSLPARLAEARLLVARQDLDGARVRLDSLLIDHPGDAETLALSGDLHLQARELEEAAAMYRQAVDASSQPLADRLKLVMVLIEQGAIDDAREALEPVLAAVPQHPGANFALGFILYAQGDHETAIPALALAEVEQQRYPLALLFSGLSHYALGHLEQAEPYARQFHSLYPQHPQGRLLLATIEAGNRNFDKAVSLTRPVVEQAPTNLPALNLLATALIGQGSTDEALEILQRVAELDPESSVAQVRLGAGLLMAGQPDAQLQSDSKQSARSSSSAKR
jgi:putative PEP-CTERM system TPR-repeat lipoprotein